MYFFKILLNDKRNDGKKKKERKEENRGKKKRLESRYDNQRYLRLDEITESVVVRFQKLAPELFVADTLDHATLPQSEVELAKQSHLFLHSIGLAEGVETGNVVIKSATKMLVNVRVEIEPAAENVALALFKPHRSLRFSHVQVQVSNVLQRPAESISQQDERLLHPFSDEHQLKFVVQLLNAIANHVRVFIE